MNAVLRSWWWLCWLGIGCVSVCAGEETGRIEGVVTYVGQVPLMKVVDHEGRRDPLLDVGPGDDALRYAVVYLDISANAETRVRPERDARESEPPLMDQLNYRFMPRVLAVCNGELVAFSNSDTANHNVRASSLIAENQFNVQTSALGRYEHRFRADPKRRPVLIGCDIHGWMQGWIYVFDHPHFAVTSEDGRFRIVNVAPGRYTLVVRQPDGGLERTLEVSIPAGQTIHRKIEFTDSDLRIR